MKKRQIPPAPRKYIRMMVEKLKRGVVGFEYLERRVVLDNVKSRKGL